MRLEIKRCGVERAPHGSRLVDFARVDVDDVLIGRFGSARNVRGVDGAKWIRRWHDAILLPQACTPGAILRLKRPLFRAAHGVPYLADRAEMVGEVGDAGHHARELDAAALAR